MALPCEQDGTSTDFEEHSLELRGGGTKKEEMRVERKQRIKNLRYMLLGSHTFL